MMSAYYPAKRLERRVRSAATFFDLPIRTLERLALTSFERTTKPLICRD